MSRSYRKVVWGDSVTTPKSGLLYWLSIRTKPPRSQVSDLVRAHVREPWQCFEAALTHDLEEKQQVRLCKALCLVCCLALLLPFQFCGENKHGHVGKSYSPV